MARIDLDLAHSYARKPRSDADYALRPLELCFEDGGAYALLGPSGCGKSTMLNIISGLLAPSQGRVLFDGVEVNAHSPQQRNIAQVFQFPVIYDTMTVADNLAFPLRNRKLPEDRIRRRVGEIAEMLGMSQRLGERAAGLSADDKQKISLGRGLVREDVSAVLFDEPLTVIDPHMKWQLRRQLKQIHRELRLTLIYVTHDQIEALTFADQVVVMSQGQVVQNGTPEELFLRPAHTFVAHFIGSPGMNLVPAIWREGRFERLGGGDSNMLSLESPPDHPAQQLDDGPVTIGVRPEHLRLATAAAPGSIPVEIVRILDLGSARLIEVCSPQRPELRIKARVRDGEGEWQLGQQAHALLLGARTCIYRNEELVA